MTHEIQGLMETGGWPGQVLVAVSLFLWASVWLRARALGGSVLTAFRQEAQRVQQEPGDTLEALRDRTADRLTAGRDVLRALVVVAPLLGLLGTVGGMVELFDSLHGGVTAVGRGSVAGGISTALVTTQLGLVIGVPGLVAARFLEQRERKLRDGLDEILNALTVPEHPPREAT